MDLQRLMSLQATAHQRLLPFSSIESILGFLSWSQDGVIHILERATAEQSHVTVDLAS